MRKPTEKYRTLLIKAGVLTEESLTLVDPSNREISKLKEKHVILQQGTISWNHWANDMRKKVDFAITPNIEIYRELLSKDIRPFLLEFPIDDIYHITTPWSKRQDAIYYHGRVIPGKLNIEELKKIIDNNIQIVMRGPVCKEYWTDVDIEKEEFIKFREEFDELTSSGAIDLETARDDEGYMIRDLNRYKFYFTLSTGEAFNLALQEAIACGTVPIVRRSGAYWWAAHLLVNFQNVDKLIKSFNQYKDEDLDEYSKMIAKEIKSRCGLEAIHDKYEYQKTHDI